MSTRILVPLDGTEAAEAGLSWATEAAECSGAAVSLLRVVEGEEGDTDSAREEALQYLAERRSRMPSSELVSTEVLIGSPQELIRKRTESSELAVMTYGTRQWLFGGVLDHLLRTAACPLIVISGRSSKVHGVKESKKLLVAMDRASHSNEVLPAAKTFAEAFGMSLVLCHVVPPIGFHRNGDRAPEGVARVVEDSVARGYEFLGGFVRELSEGGVTAETVVSVGEAPQEIVATAERAGAGLVAMATRGPANLSRVLGSAAYGVLQFGRLPSLLVCTPTAA